MTRFDSNPVVEMPVVDVGGSTDDTTDVATTTQGKTCHCGEFDWKGPLMWILAGAVLTVGVQYFWCNRSK